MASNTTESGALAFGLMRIADWGTQSPFLDIAKVMRPWKLYENGWSGGPVKGDDIPDGVLDENGWPVSLGEGAFLSTTWSWANEPGAAEERGGVYVLTYKGEGSIALHRNMTMISSEPGRIVFETSGADVMQMLITATDPEGTGDYLRDISIVHEDDLELHEAGAIFNPDWIEKIRDAGQLRFMDWQMTNNSAVSEWADMISEDNYTWAGEPSAPVSVMVALANEVGADPWFCMPHDATPEFIREFATYVRDNLDPRLQAHVEFSNELWNGAFRQFHDTHDRAVAEWGLAEDDWTGLMQFQGMLATKAALIWEDVFGAEADARLVNVLATQTAIPFRTKQMLDPVKWAEIDPEGYVDPATVFEAVAATSYFGSGFVNRADMRAELLAAIEDPAIDAQAWLHDQLLDPAVNTSIPYMLMYLGRQGDVAAEKGLDLLLYEGGQHVHHYHGADDGTLSDFLGDFVRSPWMADLYQALWDGWAEIGDGPFMQFGDVEVASRYGSWGLYAFLGDESPRAELLERLAADTGAWWDMSDRDISGFEHGVTIRMGDGDDAVAGTDEEDFLLGGGGDDALWGGAGDDGLHGGDGNDTLFGGAGDDVLAGGEGTDTVILRGARADYSFTLSGDDIEMSGADGVDLLVGIEKLRFDDETVWRDDFVGVVQAAAPSMDQLLRDDAADALAGASTVEGGRLLLSDAGTSVMAVSKWSLLGAELRADGIAPDTVYLAYASDAAIKIDGVQITINYKSMQMNSHDGAEITGSAMETAELLSLVAISPDSVQGGAGNDRFFGRNADDIVFGGDGADWIEGGGGADRLAGEGGGDTLTGGGGADVFMFGAGDGVDRIRDFTAEDRLELSGFDVQQGLGDAAGTDAAGDLMLEWGDDALIFEGLGLADLAMLEAALL